MRPKMMVLALLAAASLVSAVAIAANPNVKATFESLSASGVTGEATLNSMPKGGTMIKGSLQGLEPNVEYSVRVYDTDQTCASGASSVALINFVANPAGRGHFNTKAVQEISGIRSISVGPASGSTVQACAAVTQ